MLWDTGESVDMGVMWGTGESVRGYGCDVGHR